MGAGAPPWDSSPPSWPLTGNRSPCFLRTSVTHPGAETKFSILTTAGWAGARMAPGVPFTARIKERQERTDGQTDGERAGRPDRHFLAEHLWWGGGRVS